MSENEVDSQIESLRRRCDSALQRRLDNPDRLSPSSLIRILCPVIEKYLSAGLSLEEIAKALQEEGLNITKWHLVRYLGNIRAENGLPPIKRGRRPQDEKEAGKTDEAPVARGDGWQKDARPSPSPAPAPALSTVTPSPARVAPAAPAATAPAPRQPPTPQPMPLPGQKKEERRPLGISDEMWALKPKIDRILSSYAAPDREYPELADARWWTDSRGKRWDVRADEKPDTDAEAKQFDRAKIIYGMRWRELMEKWGLAQNIRGELIPRYKIAEEYLRPLAVDLDQIIAKHLD